MNDSRSQAITRACPACDEPAPPSFFSRKQVPVHQNLLMRSRDEAVAIPRGDLDLRLCPRCGLVRNAAFERGLLSYGHGYENTQVCSSLFEHYVDSLVDDLLTRGVEGKHVVEVGCGSGYFLRKLCERGGNTGVGFDPAYRGPENEVRTRYVREFFGKGKHAGPVDVIICRHVIEHVPSPVAFLSEIREAVSVSGRPLAYFETPALEWILENGAIWDIFYEHCCYFSAGALRNVFRLAGYEPRVTRRVFEEQYMWLESSVGGPVTDLEPLPDALEQRLVDLDFREARLARRWMDRVERLAAEGPLAVWGAGAKGATFVNLVDPTARWIDGLIDINPKKHGHYVPGTGHPILAPESMAERSVRNVVLMNPNYLDEVQRLADALRLDCAIHVAEAVD